MSSFIILYEFFTSNYQKKKKKQQTEFLLSILNYTDPSVGHLAWLLHCVYTWGLFGVNYSTLLP